MNFKINIPAQFCFHPEFVEMEMPVRDRNSK